MSDGPIVVTGDAVTAYDILSFRRALKLEIDTGMVMRRGFSVVKAAVKRGYVTAGTCDKRKAYAQLDALCVEVLGMPSVGLRVKP